MAQAPIDELRAARGSGKTLEELFIGLVGGDAQPHGRARLDLMMPRILRAFVVAALADAAQLARAPRRRDTLERFSIAVEQLAPTIAASSCCRR